MTSYQVRPWHIHFSSFIAHHLQVAGPGVAPGGQSVWGSVEHWLTRFGFVIVDFGLRIAAANLKFKIQNLQ